MQLKNSFLFIFIFIILSSFSFANMCQDYVLPNVNCLMVTPTISCITYNYSIYDKNNGSLVINGNLINYAENTYSFNFSQSEGDYLVILCDGTTREVYVNNNNLNAFGQSFNWLAIVIIIGGISFVCLWISKLIKKDNLFLLKELLFFFGLINSFVFVVLTLFISSGASMNNFNNYFNTYVFIVVFLLVFIIAYYSFIFFKDIMLDLFNESKK